MITSINILNTKSLSRKRYFPQTSVSPSVKDSYGKIKENSCRKCSILTWLKATLKESMKFQRDAMMSIKKLIRLVMESTGTSDPLEYFEKDIQWSHEEMLLRIRTRQSKD